VLSASFQNSLLLFLAGQSFFWENATTAGRMVHLWHHDTLYDNIDHSDTLYNNESMIFFKGSYKKVLQKGRKSNTTSICSKTRTLITALSASSQNSLLLYLVGQSFFPGKRNDHWQDDSFILPQHSAQQHSAQLHSAQQHTAQQHSA
jgi:hypothetical protein